MKHSTKQFLKTFTFLAAWSVMVAGCGSSTPDRSSGQEGKARLDQLRAQHQELGQQIRELEEELAKTDTAMASALNAKLVELSPVSRKPFSHYIELQGKVEAEDVAYVTPRGAGGQVRAVHVKQGDYVRKGQLLITLDDALIRQQIEQANIQLDLAQTLYERRKNLWEKQIGTEIELLQAKNNVENLRKQLALLEEQAEMTRVYAAISGVAEMVNIRVGEFFTPQSANALGIRIVNTDRLKIVAEVPENYLHKVEQGSKVTITLPDIGKTVESKISVKGRTIDPSSRAFYVEARIPSSSEFRPNQIAVMKIQDYSAANALTIPLNTLQNDEKGKYVMVAERDGQRLIARKKSVRIGELYGNDLEILEGLDETDSLITEGYQGLYDGQPITTGQQG